MGVILRHKLITHNEQMWKLPCQFVTNFVSYVSAKYYLNWFTVGKVIAKAKKANFSLRHSLHYTELRWSSVLYRCTSKIIHFHFATEDRSE